MKQQSWVFSVALIVASGLCVATANADEAKRAWIASSLFKLPAAQTNYNYNLWKAMPGASCGYRGGHTGLDIQTKDRSTSRAFYALARGTVVSTGGPFNTIAVFDSRNNRTVLYLHASQISVRSNQQVSAGTLLGYQGRTGPGVTGPHVHLEVRPGRQLSAACDANQTINPESVWYD